MKFLICGVGSIGERHIRNLLSLGYEDICLFRKKNKPLRTIDKHFITFDNLDKALDSKPDVVIISNPTHLHMETAIKCAKAACNIFIEKPISHSLESIHELSKILDSNGKIAMIGFMMRYHPCLQKIKNWIDNHRIGKIISYRSIWGEYLPDWHPWEDYRDSYASLKNMGGGPTLTLSHELDNAFWLFGKPNKVVGILNFNSDLEINTEHCSDMLLGYDSGITGNIHLDYVQKPPKRTMEILGSKGKVEFDYYLNKCSIFIHEKPDVEEYVLEKEFDRNNLFVKEIKEFIFCVKNNKKSPIPIEEAEISLRTALKVLKSGG